MDIQTTTLRKHSDPPKTEKLEEEPAARLKDQWRNTLFISHKTWTSQEAL